MFERTFLVKYISEKNNFLYLPLSFKFLKTGLHSSYGLLQTCLRLNYKDEKELYLSVHSTTGYLDEKSIGINSLLGKALGLNENEPVTLYEISQPPCITSIKISPLNKVDYDVIEMLSGNIQETLLNQIRVVNSGQKFVIWIGQNINVTVNVDSIQPVSPGAIDFLTEVHIDQFIDNIPKTPLDTTINSNNDNQKKPPFSLKVLESFNKYFKEDCDYDHNSQKYFECKTYLVCRLVALKDLPLPTETINHLKPFNIFVPEKTISEYQLNVSTTEKKSVYSLTLLTNDVFSNKTIFVQLIPLETILKNHKFNLSQTLLVDDQVFHIFGTGLGCRVIVKQIENHPIVTEIFIHTKKNYLTDIIEEFKKYLAQGSDEIFILNGDVPVRIGNNIVCSLKFSPVEAKYCLVDDHLVRNCKYVVENENVVIEQKTNVKEDHCEIFENISNYQRIIDEILQTFTINDNGSLENVLIIGKPGTGKTSLLKTLCAKLQKYPYYFYVKIIKCKSIKGKTMDSLQKLFSTDFSELILRQPSILVLDDLHVLCERIQGDDTTPNVIYFNRVSDMLRNFLKFILHFHQIAVCATAESTEKLNTHLYSTKGNHLFKNVHSIGNFAKIDRVSVLKSFFKNDKCDGVNYEDLSIKTEGFVVQDLVDFYNKTIYESLKDASGVDDSVIINKDHCEKALKNTCVISLENVSLHSPGENDFSNIGGLHDIKKVLMESLVWPVQYPGIFSNAPLRLQSGLLLYGPPGTGKTLLAAAAAKQFGLRLISVKGPELLSKYIGASEQAVRDIFQKAESVRPCILFFDEFDSLAPRRGHDNTGVTDRVVNQLLTQLDGVESLTGVCVLAATSRPDLLDPALLRPGRLDQQLHCPLPDEDSRFDILTVLSRKIDLAPDADLKVIAKETEYFSGADLKSLLYSAQLSTIDNLLEKNNVTSNDIGSKITHQHLREALAKTKPSLPVQERLKYERIYAKFQTGSTVEATKAGSRATLA
ncbi:unnamed protein product [Phaedon cochleariae]|uniref:Peroxisomal ATPase PEX1 n=1 Tax=Phaedon cochleariae TaxID=80249 RepID=A0A9P0DVA8_PHACE|nr:unnamed protein product [Phaedon cochleariae]